MKSKFAVVPYFVWVAVFAMVPLVLVLFFSFTEKTGAFTLENFIEVGRYSGVFANSIVLGGISTLVCLLVGYPMAMMVARIPARLQGTAILLIMLPMWVNFLLRTYAWMTLLEHNGLINRFLQVLGVGPLDMINTQGAVVLGMVYNFLPYMILPIYSVLVKIDKRLIEAAQDLGAGRRAVFLRMTLPLTLPGVISGVTMVFVPAVSTFIISKMLGGGSNMLIGDLIEMQFLGSSYNPHLGSAMALMLMIIMLICVGIMNQLEERKV